MRSISACASEPGRSNCFGIRSSLGIRFFNNAGDPLTATIPAGGGRGELKVQLGTDWTDLIDLGVGGEQSLQLSQLMARFTPAPARNGTTTTPTAPTTTVDPMRVR